MIGFPEDRQKSAQWAADCLKEGSQTLILDTETTGFEGEVIELAIIDLSGQVRFNSRFKPNLPIEAGAYRVHQIDEEMLAKEPTWESYHTYLGFMLGQARRVLIYNAEFDTAILANTNQVHNCPQFSYKPECVMLPYAAFVGEWNDYYGNYKWQRLPAGDHSALGDCKSTLAILKRMAAEVNHAQDS